MRMVRIAAGAVTIPVRQDDLAVTTGDVVGAGPRRVPPGTWTLTADAASTTITVG